MKKSSPQEIIRKCYLEILNREPDKEGFEHYVNLLLKNEISEEQLIEIFKNSMEYKLSHPSNLDKNKVSVNDLMKQDWDQRAKMDVKFVIATGHSKNDEDFWKSGIDDCKNILGTKRFQLIHQNNDPKKMRVLEIGCGIGRILIPMSQIFGEVVGVDVSSEMVNIGKKNIKNISNCKIFENSGSDLSIFSDDYFDFCYSFIVFQHIPEKKIIENYLHEVRRVLKNDSIFRFQVRGNVDNKPSEITTWDGVRFTSQEIHKLAMENYFNIIEETSDSEEYYWLTFQLKK